MRSLLATFVLISAASASAAAVGDPQLMTDHPWYRGELSCSTFDRLFALQKELYEREVGRVVDNDEDKALASYYWRNLVFYHNDGPHAYLFDGKLENTRDYWTGLFAFGFSLCGTTHSQWIGEMDRLLGHCRSRMVSVAGHSSFEAFLTGGAYGEGRWAMIDHDISTIVFDDPLNPTRLLSLWEMAYSTAPPEKTQRSKVDLAAILDNSGAPVANRGWLKSGLHRNDAIGSLTQVTTVQPLSGYAGPPPMLSLRRGETLRRYLRPGLGGTDFVYWGRNDNPDDRQKTGILGPARAQTWANQPEAMFRATKATSYKPGRATYGNGVYTYTPDFADGSYRDGIIAEGEDFVTFHFNSPYVIGAKPAGTGEWDWREPGGTEGLVITGKAVGCTVRVSNNSGATWSDEAALDDRLDLTDFVKGRHSYQLRLSAGASALADKNLTIRTVVQGNDRLMPHLADGGSTVTFQSSGRAVFSAGPNREQAQPFVIEGQFGSGPDLTMAVPSPQGAPILEVYAAAWVASGSPPNPDHTYRIECSTDSGETWTPIVADWQVRRPGGYGHEETGGHWSQSFCYGSLDISEAESSAVQVRFTNDGRRSYRKAEVHLVYRTSNDLDTRVTFNWTDEEGTRSESRLYPAGLAGPDSSWIVPTRAGTVTNWVEFEPVPVPKLAVAEAPAAVEEAVSTASDDAPVATSRSWYGLAGILLLVLAALVAALAIKRGSR